MKTLREMMDLVSESSRDTTELNISDMFGGGKIVTSTELDQNGDVEWYSYSYLNDHISDKPVISYEVSVGKEISVEKFENGNLTGQFSNMDDDNVRTTFAERTGTFMNEYFTGKRQMRESEKIADVFEEFKRMSDDIIKSSQRRQARLRAEEQIVDEEVTDEAVKKIESLFKDR